MYRLFLAADLGIDLATQFWPIGGLLAAAVAETFGWTAGAQRAVEGVRLRGAL